MVGGLYERRRRRLGGFSLISSAAASGPLWVLIPDGSYLQYIVLRWHRAHGLSPSHLFPSFLCLYQHRLGSLSNGRPAASHWHWRQSPTVSLPFEGDCGVDKDVEAAGVGAEGFGAEEDEPGVSLFGSASLFITVAKGR